MKTPHEKQPVTHAEKRRAAIILVEIIVLLLAVFAQNMQANTPVQAAPVDSAPMLAAPVMHTMHVYILEGNLYIDDAYLMPLASDLLWSGTQREVMMVHTIADRHDEVGLNLPAGAELVDSLEIMGDMTITHLDSHHARVDYNGGELVLMSYGETLIRTAPAVQQMALCSMTNYRHGVESGDNFYLINLETGHITYLLNSQIEVVPETQHFDGTIDSEARTDLPRACGDALMVFTTTATLQEVRTNRLSAILDFGDEGVIRLTDSRYASRNFNRNNLDDKSETRNQSEIDDKSENYSPYGFMGMGCSRGYSGH
ncbi:MAG: hypothetical protein ACPG7F_05875 [Aggregatilineales bacterium]